MFQRLRTFLAGVLGATDELASRLARRVDLYFIWPLVYATCLGSGVFTMRHLSWVPQLDTNKLPQSSGIQMAIWSGVGLALYWVLQGIIRLVQRFVRKRSVSGLLAEVNRRLLPLLSLPAIMALTLENIERDSPKETPFLIALIATLVGIGAYAWFPPQRVEGAAPARIDEPMLDAPPRRSRSFERIATVAAFVAILGVWAAYAWFFSKLAITNHHALYTRTTDLGYYDNIFYQSAHGKPLGCSFIRMGYHGSAHFDPILILLSPLYRLYSHAEFLLVLQSIWLGAGVIPVYLIAKDKLGSRIAGVALAVMFALFPALHGANMYEFHSLSLLTTLVLFAFYFLERQKVVPYALFLALSLLCREDASLVMSGVGLYAILRGGKRFVRFGWVTIACSLVYFVIVKRFFMTSVDPLMSGTNSYSFGYYYEELIPNHNSIGGLAISLTTNPVFVLRVALGEPKILYFIAIFLPVVFLPLFAKKARATLIYGLFFCLLASRGAVYSTHFQYSSILIPFVFALTPIALQQIIDADRVRRIGLDGTRLSRALLVAAFASSVLMSWKYGAIVDNATFHGGFGRIARKLDEKQVELYRFLRAESDKIPKDARVGTTNRVGAYVSNRRYAYFFPEHTDVDYLVVDEGEIHGPELDKLKKEEKFALLTRKDKIAVYKRK